VSGLPEVGWVNEVREDLQRKGLLFAATERGVYVSFNDGDSWDSLQLNLPPTAVRGLAIRGDDLVAATFGRSFWILDDVSALRQMTPQFDPSKPFLFTPQIAYRMRRQGLDNPLPPEMPTGQNPPDGAILDYYLTADVSGPVELEIWDSAGNLVRHYSSADQEEPVDPKKLYFADYWVRPSRTLSARAGMHRFVWDLRYTPPRVSEHRYSRAEIPHDTAPVPGGPFVLPGRYTAKLTVNSVSQTHPLIVKMDPRINISPELLQLQFTILKQMCAAIDESTVALQQITALNGQLSRLESRSKDARLDEVTAPIRDQLAKSAGAFRQASSFLTNLLNYADSADAPPTEDAQAMIHKVLDEMYGAQFGDWKRFRDEKLPEINMRLRGANLPELGLEQK